MKEELKKYIDSYLNNKDEEMAFKKIMFGANLSKRCSKETPQNSIFEDRECCSFAASSLDNFLKDNEDKNKFQTVLFKYIDNKNLKDSDVYNKVHIDRRLFSKIRSDEEYHPSKETVLLLGLSLELNETEIEELLDSASYSLPKNNYYDLIMRFCFKNKIYNLSKVNDLLDEYKCKLFNY